MSSRKFDHLEKYFFFELLQIKCYLALLNYNYPGEWREAEFTIFFVCGDWRPPIPCVKSAILTFTFQEIEEAWQTVVRHAKKRGWL
jgi:hypothetical protein